MQFSGNRLSSAGLSVLVLAVVFLALNASLAVHLWAPYGNWTLVLVPVVESIVLLWLLCLGMQGLRSRRTRRRLSAALGALFGILSGFSIAEAFFRYYYARSFAPRGDIGMIRGALLFFLGEIGPFVDLLAPLAFALLLAAFAAAGWVCVLCFSALLSRLRHRTAALAALTVPVVVALITGLPQSVTALTARSWLHERRIDFVEVPVITVQEPQASAVEDTSVDAPVYRFPGLRDRDIYVFVIESYGYSSIYRPELAERLDPYRSRFEETLRAHGYGVVTNYLRSPVAGGFSWLAEATFLTSQWIDSQGKFLRLYDGEVPTLSGTFQEAGYYTFTVRPGMVLAPWPEGWDLYGFEDSLIAHDGGFGYAGPGFAFVPVTDQFALWTGNQRIRELTGPGGPAAERPLFAYYQLVSSHTPFNAIPPVIENWEDLGSGSIYRERWNEIQRFDSTWRRGTQMIEGYIAAISYVFAVITDYVDRVMDHRRDPIIIVFGDHEPQRPVRSAESVLSVPIHVAARDTRILECFAASGYDEGMRGSQVPPHNPMSSFFPMFIELARNCR